MRNAEHIDCVNSIYIKEYNYSKRKEKIDTSKFVSKVFYDKNDEIIKRFDYFRGLEKPSQIITYDSLSRILNIERNDGNQITEVISQYFSNNSKYPDSLNIYSNGLTKRKQIINHFSDTLVIKQELFTNDTLRNYTFFEYDNKKRLIKELNINTKYGFGIILDKSFTGTETKKDLNPNDSTFYKYENKLDTLIISEYQENKLERVKKILKNENVEIDIKQDYWKGKLSNTVSTFKWKDSSKTEYRSYNDKLELRSYGNTFFYSDKIVSKWKHSMTNDRPENIVITRIKIIYDRYGNWINKSFILNEFKEREIKRKIEYNCH
ncbi:hypothetical protein [uncultured Lutibacter sp.]|uniref:hypothetical protein n=1 Tax=uncultured Lutibacter sp. TaxID=437739 RepID=UPI00260831B0|nr:hypothetical protein [uncultured Lutibacter sp.]